MNQPNPWILFMGGIALLNVSFMVFALHAPAWARYTGAVACIGLGLFAMGLGLWKQFHKKPPREKFVPRRRSAGAKTDRVS
jgi:hypothetical protein